MLEGVPQDWLEIILDPKLAKAERAVSEITPDDKLCPPKDLWFEWARLTPLDSIKVIIIGQDPYYDLGTAHGLAFSSKGKKIPPSLRNVYKCLVDQHIIEEMPKHADLTVWAKRGVLLLNAALSTELGTPAKHSKIWKPYVQKLVQAISAYGIGTGKKYAFLLWGNLAKGFGKNIDPHHDILEWIHPSSMAQTRAAPEKKFINCNHFSICAEKYDVDWSFESTPATDIVDRVDTDSKVNHVDPVDKDDKEDVVNKNEKRLEAGPYVIQVFTDGSCKNNGTDRAVGGFAAIFVNGPLKGKRLRGKIANNATNIRAEGLAIICVLDRLASIDPASWKKAEIYTDSEFWLNMLTLYMPKWDAAKFDKQKNPDMTKRMWSLWNSFPGQLEIIWVPAHNKLNWANSASEYERWCFKHNDAVDKLADVAGLG